MTEVVALDVGGTAIKAARVDDGGVLAELVTATPPAGGADAVSAIADVVTGLRTTATAAVGVAVPGLVADGIVAFAANLGWRDVRLQEQLRAATGLPAVVGHDVTLAALAECADTDGMYVSLGTGIASSEVEGGAVRRGSTGRAGELGHVPVHADGEACRCGQRGCLEAYASAGAIARRYAARTGNPLTTQEIVGQVATDEAAAAVWHEAVEALSIALAHEILVRDPALIVLGGGLAEAGHTLLEPLQAELARRLVLREPPELRTARLGALAGRTGAARLARQLAVAGRTAEREGCSS